MTKTELEEQQNRCLYEPREGGFRLVCTRKDHTDCRDLVMMLGAEHTVQVLATLREQGQVKEG